MVAMTDRLDTIPITCCRWPGPRSDRPERWPLASHTTQHHALRGYVVSAVIMAASVGPAPGALPRSRPHQSRALLITHSGGGVHPAQSMQGDSHRSSSTKPDRADTPLLSPPCQSCPRHGATPPVGDARDGQAGSLTGLLAINDQKAQVSTISVSFKICHARCTAEYASIEIKGTSRCRCRDGASATLDIVEPTQRRPGMRDRGE